MRSVKVEGIISPKSVNRYVKAIAKGENPTGGMAERLEAAQRCTDILNQKIAMLENGQSVKEGNAIWLSVLRRFFGTNKFEVNNPDNPAQIMAVKSKITPESLNSKEAYENLRNALSTMLHATLYKPRKILLNGTEYSVHNRAIARKMKASYNEDSLKEISKYFEEKRIFDLTDDPKFGFVIDKKTGLIKTCGASENWEMGDRLWVTDSMRVGDIQKIERPETWTRSLTSIATFYDKQASAFEKIHKNPELFREGGAMEGVAHIFLPKTFEADPNWFNNKRLESAGLALKEMSLAITDGLVKGKDYGFKTAQEVPDKVINSIEYLARYFKDIDYPTAPSAGNWEEIPIKGGLTWDTEAIRSGYEALRDLVYNPKYSSNPEIRKVRARLNVDDEKTLTKLIKDGEKRIRANYLAEAPGIREMDSSLVFLTTSDVKLADDVFEDIAKHVEILETVEKNLVRENGIIRYAPFNFKLNDGSMGHSPDSYLNLNYFIAADKEGKLNLKWKEVLDNFGSKDASEPDIFNARAKLSADKMEAQWFMVSEMSAGYGKQLQKYIKALNGAKPTAQQSAYIEKLKEGQTRLYNKMLARISDENPAAIHQVKANGLPMPKNTISEATQYVTDLNGQPSMVSGTNAPLAWALASGKKAHNLMEWTIKYVI